MNRLPLAAAVALGVGIAIAITATAGDAAYWRAFLRGDVVPAADSAHALTIRGGDGASIPPAAPLEQGIDPEALATARETARRMGASAFAVARRGHALIVWSSQGDQTLVRSALLSRLVAGAGAADAAELGPSPAGSLRNPWSARSRWRYGAAPPGFAASRLSVGLWRPMNASEARVELDANGAARIHCCFWLRPRDALALSTALLAGGRIGGEELVDAATATRLLQSMDDGVAPRGAEPFGSRPARLWRDGEGTRLYSFPAQELAILLVRAEEARLTDETEIAHQVLRGVVDRAAPDPTPVPRELVPAH